jgi:DNA-binding NtrC family response regulator
MVATMKQIEVKALENAIIEYGGNVTKACRALKISRDKAYRMIDKSQRLQDLLREMGYASESGDDDDDDDEDDEEE